MLPFVLDDLSTQGPKCLLVSFAHKYGSCFASGEPYKIAMALLGDTEYARIKGRIPLADDTVVSLLVDLGIEAKTWRGNLEEQVALLGQFIWRLAVLHLDSPDVERPDTEELLPHMEKLLNKMIALKE